MRSPIYWLDSVKSPTFLIEGSDGNSANLKKIERTSNNENIHCYVMEGADHFSVLAPLTRVVAQKILADTGTEPNITITQEELDAAMKMEPEIPMPVMEQHTIEALGMNLSYPYLWDVEDISENEELSLMLCSRYEEDNIWDMSLMYIDSYNDLQLDREYFAENGYDISEMEVGGLPALKAVGKMEDNSGSVFNDTLVAVQKGDTLVTFEFYIHEDFGNTANPMFDAILESVSFTQ